MSKFTGYFPLSSSTPELTGPLACLGSGPSIPAREAIPAGTFSLQPHSDCTSPLWPHQAHSDAIHQSFDEKGYAQGGYDSLDRLRKVLRGELSASGGYSATGGGNVIEEITLPNTDEERKYLLDGLGNWEQSDYIPVGGTPTVDLRQHNKQNQITSRKEEAKVLFTYDANGNLKDDGVLLYDYDALNRLTQVRRKSNGQTIGQYSYDAQNRRIRKTISNGGLTGNIPSGTTDFIYRDWQVMEERSGSTVNKQYVWGDYIDECIQLRTYVTSGAGSLAAGLYYPLQDLLYRTKALTDSSGEIVEAYDYDPYGNTLIFSEAGAEDNWWADDAVQANYAACEALYAGYRYDAESKTYQVRNRQYNPVLGRWTQRDPIGFEGGDWNLYGYVRNVVDDTDPNGTQSVSMNYEEELERRLRKELKALQRGLKPTIKPVYGNYCGPQSGAEPGTRSPSPKDDLDRCCYQHDKCWEKQGCHVLNQLCIAECRRCNILLCTCALTVECKTIACDAMQRVVIAYSCNAYNLIPRGCYAL